MDKIITDNTKVNVNLLKRVQELEKENEELLVQLEGIVDRLDHLHSEIAKSDMESRFYNPISLKMIVIKNKMRELWKKQN